MSKAIIITSVLVVCIAIACCVYGFITYQKRLRNRFIHKKDLPDTFSDEFPWSWYQSLIQNTTELTFAEFRQCINQYKNIKVCYIIENKTKVDKIYVGQSINLGWRVPQHFYDVEKGNYKIRQDFNANNVFTVRLIKWNQTMPDINVLEAGLIRYFKSDSFYGYNRSLGRNTTNSEVIKTRK
ncbi:MAG: GIY-YIG nuclease family protein [Mycoplasmataceae bacterium]|nr:GIY-YIG nuclease family protein [Mycoplasmataceae bacterium]